MADEQKKFNPNEHLLQLKSKAGSQDYLPVQWRLVWFRSECPNGTIETEEIAVELDRSIEAEAHVWNAGKRRSEKVIKQAKGYARFRAVITDGKGGKATATGSEAAVDFADYIEKAETKAIGRALAMLGYGTQFAPEFAENHRIVDAPVDSPEPAPQQQPEERPAQTPPAKSPEPAASTQQSTQADRKSAEVVKTPAQIRKTLQEAELIDKLTERLVDFPRLLEIAFAPEIKQGKYTLEKLQKVGDELPPAFCKRLTITLNRLIDEREQASQAA